MMKNEHLGNATEHDAVETIMRGLSARREPERQKWITMVATTAISVLHGTYGKEFAAGFLAGAVKSLTDPAEGAPIEIIEVPEQKQ